jgi:DNA-binding MarR family transcriptional regulator
MPSVEENVSHWARRGGGDPARGVAVGFSLWRAAMRWQRGVDAALAEVELTHTQYLVLSSADAIGNDAKQALTQRAIANRAGLDEVTTSRLVRALAERGLLERERTAGDARALRVIVTRKGVRALRAAAPLVRAAAKRFFAQPVVTPT